MRVLTKLIFCFLLVATLWAKPAKAGLFFCNYSGEEATVAVAWNDNGTWFSRGWYDMKPQECTATALIGVLTNDRYWYYATSKHLQWSGDGEGSGQFCTSNNAFFFRDANNLVCEGHTFKGVNVGDAQQFTVTLSEARTDPRSAALNCRGSLGQGTDAFTKCWMQNVATSQERRILSCVDQTDSAASLALCAAKEGVSADAYKAATCANRYVDSRRGDQFIECLGAGQLSTAQAAMFQCVVNTDGNLEDMPNCALQLGGVNDESQRIYSCVASNINDYARAGLCAAGTALTPEQNRVASCVLNNAGSYMQMAVCAEGNNLTPEQQAFASCAISTGGEPLAFAGCVGTQLTSNELQKCVTRGIGGDGCFGDNNTVVQFVGNAWKDVTQGPGPTNDLLGRDGFVGRKLDDIGHDLTQGAGPTNDIVGEDGFVNRKLEDVARDVTQGAGSTNDIVGKDGWVCQNIFGGC